MLQSLPGFFYLFDALVQARDFGLALVTIPAGLFLSFRPWEEKGHVHMIIGYNPCRAFSIFSTYQVFMTLTYPDVVTIPAGLFLSFRR